jgi:hypothetical protein
MALKPGIQIPEADMVMFYHPLPKCLQGGFTPQRIMSAILLGKYPIGYEVPKALNTIVQVPKAQMVVHQHHPSRIVLEHIAGPCHVTAMLHG